MSFHLISWKFGVWFSHSAYIGIVNVYHTVFGNAILVCKVLIEINAFD